MLTRLGGGAKEAGSRREEMGTASRCGESWAGPPWPRVELTLLRMPKVPFEPCGRGVA